MSKLDDIFDQNTIAVTEFIDDHGDKVTDLDNVVCNVSQTKQQLKDLMLELVTELEVKSLPSDDPKLKFWQGYHEAQLHITQKIERL